MRCAELGTSSIVALDRNTQGKLLWERKSTRTSPCPNRPAGGRPQTVSFEGTPVADARNVYVAVTDRREQTATYVACLDAETGATRWIRYLGTASSGARSVSGAFGMPMTSAAAGRRATTATACSRSTGRPSTTRPTSAPWSRSTPRPARSAGSRPIPGRSPTDRPGARARPEPGDRPRRPGASSPPATPPPSSPSTPPAAGCSGRPSRSPTRSS